MTVLALTGELHDIACSTHRQYYLSCEEYEEIASHAGGRNARSARSPRRRRRAASWSLTISTATGGAIWSAGCFATRAT